MSTQRILHHNGVINVLSNNNYEYQFFIKDHLGNTRVVCQPYLNSNGTLKDKPNELQRSDYYPFGILHGGREAQPTAENENRYLYNDKEYQARKWDNYGYTFYSSLHWYDYGARFYDAQLGRFHSIDPLAEDYSFQSPYLYAANNPIRFIDVFGLFAGPGDKFATAEAAATDFAICYNGKSITNDKEYATLIVTRGSGENKYVTYLEPQEGTAHTSSFSTKPEHNITSMDQIEGSAHTHGASTNGVIDDNFSEGKDIPTYESIGKDGYVATPSGELQKYDVETNEISTVDTPETQNIPSDPSAPVRKTYINPDGSYDMNPRLERQEWVDVDRND